MSTFWKKHRKLRYYVRIALLSMTSSLVVIGIFGALVWHNRAHIINAIVDHISMLPPAPSLPQPLSPTAPSQTPVADSVVPTTDTNSTDLSIADVVAKVNKSVVSIEVTVPSAGLMSIITETKTIGRGSGFFVSSDGLVLTNRHVVDSTQQGVGFTVITESGKKYPAVLIAKDPVLDIALLRVSGTFTPVTIGDSATLRVGQSVVAIGFALGELQNSVSVGIISGLSRSIVANGGNGSEYLDQVIQTDAAINPGNSGGPLLDLTGAVIGVNVAMARGSQSIGFALPVNSIKNVIESVKTKGKIIRPYVGIRYVPLTESLKASLGVTAPYGVVVASGNPSESAVLPGSPAARAGIVEGDIITSIDSIPLDEDHDFASIIRQKKIGATVVLRIFRKGTSSPVSVVLTEAPQI